MNDNEELTLTESTGIHSVHRITRDSHLIDYRNKYFCDVKEYLKHTNETKCDIINSEDDNGAISLAISDVCTA